MRILRSSPTAPIKALIRLYSCSILALLRLCSGSVEALFRLFLLASVRNGIKMFAHHAVAMAQNNDHYFIVAHGSLMAVTHK